MKFSNIKLFQLLLLGVLLMTIATPSKVLAENDILEKPYYQIISAINENGLEISEIIIDGPPEPPLGVYRRVVNYIPSNLPPGVNIIPNVPAFSWSFGCSATSAAMIAGYYDRNGYPNMYMGPTNWGIMPLDNSVWPDWVDGAGQTRHQCPLSATHDGLDGRVGRGHVDDYWVEYGAMDHDPFYLNWDEHENGDCTGDYMKTNQTTNYGNMDGGTTFYYYPDNPNPVTCDDLVAAGVGDSDGTNGFRLFYDSRGYSVDASNCYYRITSNQVPGGFSFEDYMAEIDDGYPVMIHVTNHTMVGVGYDTNTNEVILHDTWDNSSHTMPWGGSYVGMAMQAVSVVHLDVWQHNSADTGNWHTDSTWNEGTIPTINKDVTILEDHVVTLNTDAHVRNLTIQYGGTLVIEDGANLTVEENLYNNGLTQEIKEVTLGSTTEFFHIQNSAGTIDVYHGVDITPESNGLGSTIVELRGNHTNGCTDDKTDALINRCIRITPESEQSATIRFWFTEDERNDQAANNLSVWHHDGSWTSVGSSLVQSESGIACISGLPPGFGCYVEAQGISTYSPFGVGSDTAPTAIVLQRFDAQEEKNITLSIFVGMFFTFLGTGILLYHRRKI
jgi:hypothetical protein